MKKSVQLNSHTSRKSRYFLLENPEYRGRATLSVIMAVV